MTRSGYIDDGDSWDLIRWRGAVISAIKGRRGQAALREILEALDAMPEKILVANELEADGCYCTLGVLGKARGIVLNEIDPDDYDLVSDRLQIANALAREIMYENDEGGPWKAETPAARWTRMRAWVASQIKTVGSA